MKGRITRSTSGSREKGETDLNRLREMRDEDIDYSDIPKLGTAFWKATNPDFSSILAAELVSGG
jgi:hypothetical protein